MVDEVPLYSVPNVIGEEILEGVRDVLESGWLTLGPKTNEFEELFAGLHQSTQGVAVNSCTSALYACLRALGIGPNDTVVVPAVTFSATANVVRLLGGDVILCDVKDNGNIDPESLSGLLDTHEDISAVIPVHLYGLPCDMPEILKIAEEHEIFVIEDCAHAPGATIDGQPVGSFGDAGCFSFYATKNMTTGEGGMVTTDDPDLAEGVRKLRNHHQTRSPDEKKHDWGYDVDGLGFNFRMSEFEAVMGLSQLKRLARMNESRREVAHRYQEAISDIQGLTWEGGDSQKEHVFHLFVVQVQEDYPLTRNELYDHLSKQEIISGVHYPPLSELTYYQGVQGKTKNAEELFDRILSIPMYPDMMTEDQQRVIDALGGT
ncbi:DegT/DnrJ/EryC1/StrS aminotransferase family protein [Haladaptatus sp. YSMS36]|uniref:DegT/DnrJ/EryC1/StrS family aminotransferase n=1 Tax=Haladaptatus sp. YSMS36 TaxID=3033384 RepID=UPI0023E7B787|nr:DegT/DnrJ/EryC1/StrS family aminotransferase [Haladaptatus sp. YSMS36]